MEKAKNYNIFVFSFVTLTIISYFFGFIINENSAGGDPPASYVCDEEGYVSAIEGCCPTGPKGETGPRGMDEENMYPLILDSLRKFSECQVDLSKDSACEVLADGITKKIIKYMWPTEEE